MYGFIQVSFVGYSVVVRLLIVRVLGKRTRLTLVTRPLSKPSTVYVCGKRQTKNLLCLV